MTPRADGDGFPTNDEYRSILERVDDPRFDRRSFLKAAGFSFAGLAMASCSRAPLNFALPYTSQPEEIVPGKLSFYASLCAGCTAGCGILAHNRDGRPIKLEGNPEHPITKGGLCAVGQAAVLSLYDSYRMTDPTKNGSVVTKSMLDRDVVGTLDKIRARNGKVRILTGTITSPSTQEMIGRFVEGFSDAKHVVYDPLSISAVLDAHVRTHGARLLPRYLFENAEVIVGIDADFLGSWVSPVEYTAGYSTGRSLSGKNGRFSKHLQFEPAMTLTGSKADERFRVAPSEIRGLVRALAVHVGRQAGTSNLLPRGLDGGQLQIASVEKFEGGIEGIARILWENRSRTLVVCGTNDIETQVLVNFINHSLDSYGATLDITNPSRQKMGDDKEIVQLIGELTAGKVDALIVNGVNPVFDLPEGEAIANAIRALKSETTERLSFAISDRADETSDAAQFASPAHHFLETWNDAETVMGTVTVSQPALKPLFRSRSLRETLAAWMGDDRSDFEIVKDHWRRNIYPRAGILESFNHYWSRSVHDGFAVVKSDESRRAFNMGKAMSAQSDQIITPSSGLPFEAVLYSSVAVREGQHAHNPWLLELPDPVTKVTWDNYASISPAIARSTGIKDGDVVRLRTSDGASIELPAHIQPGQHDNVVAIALGYGRKGTDRFTAVGPHWIFAEPSTGPQGLVGVNVAGLLSRRDGYLGYARRISIEKAGVRRELAATQTHHLLSVPEGFGASAAVARPIVQETTVEDYRAGRSGSHRGHEAETMWAPDHDYKGFHWGMVVNLASCTGCSACVIACQAENNIPVVGRDEVMRSREMHWLRIDRYYSGEDGDIDTAHQPMTCHHCDRAPCETVCPVLATVHSTEGLNQQVYNRCVGTRYCSNNCPYKVRRFNWFNYAHDDQLQNMQLNPDITIRSRGVMEKCSFCVQRIQRAKTESKIAGVAVKDGDIQPACQESCPARAIVFGDMNDPESEVTKLMQDQRYYHVLDELNLKPSVGYLKVVRNRASGEGDGHA